VSSLWQRPNAAVAVFVPSEAVEILKPLATLAFTPSAPTSVTTPLFGSEVVSSLSVVAST
jgi:hypothetical protein